MSAQGRTARRAVAWVKDDPFGVLPYRLDYELETERGFATRRLRVTSRGETWSRVLDLRRNENGVWSIEADEEGNVDLPPVGGDTARFTDALDCDLGLSPVTNMMPILRHRLLHGGGPIEFTMAWVAVPALAVQADRQRYRHLNSASDHHVIRYEAVDGSFAADITVDADAVVVDYPPDRATPRRKRPAAAECRALGLDTRQWLRSASDQHPRLSSLRAGFGHASLRSGGPHTQSAC